MRGERVYVFSRGCPEEGGEVEAVCAFAAEAAQHARSAAEKHSGDMLAHIAADPDISDETRGDDLQVWTVRDVTEEAQQRDSAVVLRLEWGAYYVEVVEWVVS